MAAEHWPFICLTGVFPRERLECWFSRCFTECDVLLDFVTTTWCHCLHIGLWTCLVFPWSFTSVCQILANYSFAFFILDQNWSQEPCSSSTCHLNYVFYAGDTAQLTVLCTAANLSSCYWGDGVCACLSEAVLCVLVCHLEEFKKALVLIKLQICTLSDTNF